MLTWVVKADPIKAMNGINKTIKSVPEVFAGANLFANTKKHFVMAQGKMITNTQNAIRSINVNRS